MEIKSQHDYGKLYNSSYYENHLGDMPYDDDFWKKGFEYIADKIIKQFNPKVFLDVGCAFGYLVAALRDRGVDAYGIDISEYAISKVREDIKPYCKVSSAMEPLPDDFPSKYDLISIIEVIEHLYEKDGDELIQNICNYSERIIFSSSPDDKAEETHFNVQPASYWVNRFYKNGFFNDYNERPSYISPQCIFFRKTKDIEDVINDYELAFEELNKEHKYEIDNILEDRKKAQQIMDSQEFELNKLKNDMNILREDRRKAQQIMDNQGSELVNLKSNMDALQIDRQKAQDVMDNQRDIIKNLEYEILEKDKKYQEVVQFLPYKIIDKMKCVYNKVIGRK